MKKINIGRDDITKTRPLFSKGYGLMPKIVAQDQRLTIEAKGLYSYYVSYSGSGLMSFPSKQRIFMISTLQKLDIIVTELCLPSMVILKLKE